MTHRPRKHENTKIHEEVQTLFVRKTPRSLFRASSCFGVFVVPVCLLLLASPVRAHEIGKTQVTAVVTGHTYTIDIVVDPDALLTKLEVFGGAPPSSAG